MRILCAPDSFKESLSAAAVADAMARGIRRAAATAAVDICPVADGGEGSLEVLAEALGAAMIARTVTGPRGWPVEARLAVAPAAQLAIVALAEASGLTLVPPGLRDPTATTTFGTGELIGHALDEGARTVLVCLGGSGTVDGGAGLAQALGVIFRDARDRPMREPLTGGRLESIGRVDRSEVRPGVRPGVRIRALCDVTSPLAGARGAAAVFGPQKGATAGQVADLERGLRHLARLAGGDPDRPGAGAAGGAGFGLAAFLGASLERGIDVILEAVGFEDRCRGADLVLVGEGRLDGQSLEGKALMGVSAAAGALGVPVVAIVGELGPGAERCLRPAHPLGLRASASLSERFGRERALADTAALLEATAESVVRKFQRGL